MPSTAENEKTIFLEAAEIDVPAERAAFLDQACAGNLHLRAAVEALLASHQHPQGLLDVTASAANQPLATQIGPYKLLQQIGEGGMGTVFMAEQKEPVERRVAFKVIKPGMDTRQVIARFEAERQALAMMDHPNIAKVFDAGTTESGRPYFVMELVRGTPITKYCDEHHLTLKQRLELFLPVCQAVQHAHQKGIIHRDLKPTNVLVALYDDKPVPKVIDFGVAKAAQKLTERTMFTEFGQVVGTLEYMSPEQARLNQLDIDTRSDIYSLGVLLYELLTGCTPFDGKRLRAAAFDEMLRIIREEEPPRPSTRLSSSDTLPSIAANRNVEPARLNRALRGELDWIVMKALEKDRNRRYETTSGFAKDIEHYLRDEPVQACPPSSGYRLRKFVKRNKPALTAALLVVTALVAGICATTWQALRARRAEQKALEDRDAKASALDAEKRARQEATRASEHTLDALRAMTDAAVSRQIASQTQLTAEDRAFFTQVIAQYERLAAVQGTGNESRALRAEGHLRVGFVRHRLQEWRDALPAFERARDLYRELVADSPAVSAYRDGLARSQDQMGEVLYHLGRWPQAETEYLQAISEFERLRTDYPESPEYRAGAVSSRRNLAGLLGAGNRTAEAEAEYGRVVAASEQLAIDFPDVAAYRSHLVNCYLSLGVLLREKLKKPAEAEAQFRRALAVQTKLSADFPGVADYRKSLGRCHFSLGCALADQGHQTDAAAEYGAALAIQNKLSADFPVVPLYRQNLAQTHSNLGKLLADQKKPVEAEAEYRLALAIQQRLVDDFPDVPYYGKQCDLTYEFLATILSERGLALERQGKHAEAATALREALEIMRKRSNEPRTLQVSAVLQQALKAQGDEAGASELQADDAARLSKALESQEDNPSFRMLLGNALRDAGDFDRALTHYSATITADPTFVSAWIARGNVYLRTRQFVQAADDFSQAIMLKPDDWQGWSGRAFAHFHRQQWDEAIADYSKAIELSPEVHTNWFHRGHAHLQLQQWDKAAVDFTRVVEGWPDEPGGWHLRALAYAQANQPDKAVSDLRQAVAKGFKDVENLKNDRRFEPLRSRDDFQKLIAELEENK